MEFLRVEPPGCDLAVVRRPAPLASRGGCVVFLHGLGDASSAFAQALEAEPLAGFEIVLVDLLGHGSSDKPANFDYRPASHAAVLFQALRKLNPMRPTHLVGYSVGAAVAIELSRFPLEGLASVVLVEPAVDPSRMHFAEKVAALSEGEFRARFAEILEPYASLEAKDADRKWADTAAFASSVAIHRSAKGAFEAARRGEPLAHLRELKRNVALIVSDATYQEWPLVRELEAEGAPVFKVSAPERMPMYECPDDFYSAVRAAIEAAATR